MLRKKIAVTLLGIFLTFSVLIMASPAFAQGIIPNASGEASCSQNDPTACGDYQVNDFIVLAINVSNWILGIVGSLTLIMFIYGGVMFLISAGASDKVAQAKKIIIASIIGLIIVFSSWLIIKYATESIGATPKGLANFISDNNYIG